MSIKEPMDEASVSELLDGLRNNFLEELPSRINLIEDNILSLKNNNSYDELFRVIHSLKGSAGSYNLHEITKITHHLEDVMLYFAQKKILSAESSIDILLEYIDILQKTTTGLLENKTVFSNIEQLLSELYIRVFNETYEVLVVESSRSYSQLIENNLRGLPIQLTFATDGLLALEKLLVKKYSLLITSMETPPLNADALIAALRCTHSVNRDINALLITSYKLSNIQNKPMFLSILEKNIVKDNNLKKVVKKLLI